MPPEASSLHCPNCGAAVDFQACRCPYCQARLATVSCPQCFALMFDGAAFCPHCGTKRARDEVQGTDARCPGCRSGLQAFTIGTTHVLECPSCDGVWVDAEAFEQLCADRDTRAALLPRLAPPAPRTGPATVAPVRYRPCVRCGKMMNRVNFGALSGAVIDVCKGHGTFLDPGELHQIVTFIQEGGLDRARARQLENLREEEQKLRALERSAERRDSRFSKTPVSWSLDETAAAGLLDLISDITRKHH